MLAIFQSTHPLRGGTQAAYYSDGIAKFQSTHPLRGGTSGGQPFRTEEQISIHPPLAGWDRKLFSRKKRSYDFNPPTPCGVGPVVRKFKPKFDSISIHPPLAGWDLETVLAFFQMTAISIHPPLAGWDPGRHGATQDPCISIHPPLAGWDSPSRQPHL